MRVNSTTELFRLVGHFLRLSSTFYFDSDQYVDDTAQQMSKYLDNNLLETLFSFNANIDQKQCYPKPCCDMNQIRRM